MQNRFNLLVSDVMPIYMIIPRYSHNYAQFCQLLKSNLFTHRRILMLSREATSETYGPRVYLYHINLLLLSYLLCLYFTLHIYYKNTKKIGLLATHGDGEPPKTLDAHYVKDIMYYFDNPEKTPFNFIWE